MRIHSTSSVHFGVTRRPGSPFGTYGYEKELDATMAEKAIEKVGKAVVHTKEGEKAARDAIEEQGLIPVVTPVNGNAKFVQPAADLDGKVIEPGEDGKFQARLNKKQLNNLEEHMRYRVGRPLIVRQGDNEDEVEVR